MSVTLTALIIKADHEVMGLPVRELRGPIPFEGRGLTRELRGQGGNGLGDDPRQVTQEVGRVFPLKGDLRAPEFLTRWNSSERIR